MMNLRLSYCDDENIRYVDADEDNEPPIKGPIVKR